MYKTLEMVRLAEEAAMTELAAFGCIEMECAVPTAVWESDEFCEAAYEAYKDDEEPVCYGLM